VTPRHNINIFRTRLLQRQTNIGKLLAAYYFTNALPRNLIILTEAATQVASRNKDRPRTAAPRDWRLLPAMHARSGNPKPGALSAETNLSRAAVYAAAARAERAGVGMIDHVILLLNYD
jgi:hypothetical protein